MDAIRRVLASTADPAGRGRLRVRLADALTAAGDVTAAATELKQAAAEAPTAVGLLFGARALASRLPPDLARAVLAAVGRGTPARVAGDGSPPAGLGRAAAREGLGGRRRPPPPSLAPPLAPRAAVPAPPPAPLVVAVSGPHVVSRRDPLDLAFAALADGKPVRARKLGEEVARAGRLDPDSLNRLRDLVDGIDRAGARRQSLFLARTLVESGPGDAPAAGVVETLSSLVARALESGDVDLALRWGADLGGPLARVARTEPPVWRGGDGLQRQFREAQAAVATARGGEQVEAALEMLGPLLVGGEDALGRAALALALRVADRLGPRAAARRADLLRQAFEQDPTAEGRAYLGRRWMESLRLLGDSAADGVALGVLDRAIAETPADETPLLRGLRADLLRRLGRDAELARALESDAELAIGPDLVDLLREQADRLDRIGEADRALEVRLGALVEAPGDLALLAPARRRLEALGQLERSFDLAVAALPHVSDRAARIVHLRDVAGLAETAADDRQRAAAAWLEVLALDPGDGEAFDAAERLLRELGDEPRLAELLAWSGARTVDPEARLVALWRLGELRRREGRTAAALAHYREIIEARARSKETTDPLGEDWRRRDDRLALETARTLAAPHPAARAQALTDRALAFIEVARLDDAERDLSRAFDLNPEAPEVVAALETLHERRGDWRGLRQRLQSRVGNAPADLAARLWCGIGRASERLNDLAGAEAAYVQARTADPADRAPLAALRRLATARRDWAEASRLMEKEIERVRTPSERVGMLLEHGALLAEKLDRHDQAVEVLEAALAFQPTNLEALEAMYRAALRAGVWEKSAQALEGLIAAGGPVGDIAERYHRIGRAAEAGGKVDRALGFYSRSYARNPAFRPTLERLSEICFDRQQWDNAWKATEHLIDRHGPEMEATTRAELALRSALADLHMAQRIAAVARIVAMPGISASGGGLRDVAESWASMRFDPRLLAGVDDDRRGRVRSRLREVLSLTERTPAHPARETARATWAAMAMADRRWADAVEVLDTFGADGALDARKRSRFLVAAGDILLHKQGDAGGAALRYERARALNPEEPGLARTGVVKVDDEYTDDKVPPSRS